MSLTSQHLAIFNSNPEIVSVRKGFHNVGEQILLQFNITHVVFSQEIDLS